MNDSKHKHHHPYHHPHPPPCNDELRLEGVTVCVGFDDLLDITLGGNHPHFDTLIVVTSHADKKTQAVARKHGATCVQTDLFKKNGRNFNKGAAINSGLDLFQYRGWRLHIDCDIVLPDNFRRVIFNHSVLETHCIYGADRLNVIGPDKIRALRDRPLAQHHHGLLLGESGPDHPMGHRLVCSLRGYLPLGFFQLWHCTTQKPYPFSSGDASHDDMVFSASYPAHCRRHLPSVICYHLCPAPPRIGENWEGHRNQPRLD